MKFVLTNWLERNTPAPIAGFFARQDVKAVIEWLKEPVYAVALMFALTTIIAQPFYVPSGSMEPTLAIGDAVLAAKFPYGYSRYSIPFVNGPTPEKKLFERLPSVGDVVVFRLPRDTKVTYVKRVIGLPGDRIQMKEGRLWINGKQLPLRQSGVGESEDSFGGTKEVARFVETLPGGKEHIIFKERWDGPADNTGVYVVPEGHLFMMGDNRDNSLDSRFSIDGHVLGNDYMASNEGGVGYVPVGNLVGRAFIVIGSVDFLNAGSLLEWPLQFRFSRILKAIH
ncbi:signal peptidase I [Rhizomicrobium palustre]|uniref:Signal peptidase I n=1 Tax=Rhizomicrobium palustre TaxID=189966 RepID=A0A846N3N4_9PROT|nr:signal peptidase I [Rhizomicrobium palustre]NIK90085.1 signal peptidase I [Rhizomicrobium palustre]